MIVNGKDCPIYISYIMENRKYLKPPTQPASRAEFDPAIPPGMPMHSGRILDTTIFWKVSWESLVWRFPKPWGYPNSWMVFHGNPQKKMDDVGVPHFGKPPGHVFPIPISHFDDHLSHWLSATSCSWEAYTPLWVNSELLLSHAKLKIGTVIKISGWDWDPFCGCTYHSWLYTYLRLLSHCVPMVVGHTYAFWPPITSVGPQTNYGYQWSAHQSVQLIYFWWGCYILPFPPLGDTPLQFTILMMTNTPYGPIVPLHVKPSIQGAREGVLSTVSDGHLHITSHNHGEKNTHQHCQHWYFWKMPRKMLN